MHVYFGGGRVKNPSRLSEYNMKGVCHATASVNLFIPFSVCGMDREILHFSFSKGVSPCGLGRQYLFEGRKKEFWCLFTFTTTGQVSEIVWSAND